MSWCVFRSYCSLSLKSLPLCSHIFYIISPSSEINVKFITTKHNNYFLFALDFGPQFASGFSGNRVNLSSLEGGFASFLISKQAWILCRIIYVKIHVFVRIPFHFGSMASKGAAGDVGLGVFTVHFLT